MEKMYSANIIKGSREFTKREKLMLTDTANAESLNDATKAGAFNIAPEDYALVHVVNPNAKPDKQTGEVRDEYDVFVVIDKDSKIYQTSSLVFMESFMHIWEVMKGDDEPEDFEITCVRVPSNNNSGDYLTCKII